MKTNGQLKYALVRSRFPKIRDRGANTRKRYLVDPRPHAKRKCFATKTEATVFADRLETALANDGARSFTVLTPEQRVTAAKAFKKLHQLGKTLDEAVDFFVAHVEHERKRHASLTVAACLDEYLEQLRGDVERKTYAATSFRAAKMYIAIFRRTWGDLHITDLTEKMVRTWLDSLRVCPRSRFNYRRSLNRWLNWCVHHDHLDKNPCFKIRLPRIPSHDVVVLSGDDAKAILKAAADTKLRAYFSIALLAGCRPSEIQRLDWRDVSLVTNTITIRKEKTKVKETRYVPIHPTLATWLAPVAQKSGSVSPKNWRALFRGVLESAGYRTERKYVPDSMRHSYGSYWLALHKNRAELAEAMGNSVRMIRSNYRAPVMEADAHAYFALTPTAVKQD